MGDLSLDSLDFSDKMTEKFENIMFSNNFYSLINKSTRITDSSSFTINHIWTNVTNTCVKNDIIAHYWSPTSHRSIEFWKS